MVPRAGGASRLNPSSKEHRLTQPEASPLPSSLIPSKPLAPPLLIHSSSVLCFQKRLSAATRLQLLQETANGGVGSGVSSTMIANSITRPIPLPTIPAFLGTFADYYQICLKPLPFARAAAGNDNSEQDAPRILVTVHSGASCGELLALISAHVCQSGADCVTESRSASDGGDRMLHKVVDHHVALGCPAVTCLWCRVHSKMDGRPRGSLARGNSAVTSDVRSAKGLMVSQMLRLQALARRRLGVGADTPFVLYFQVTNSLYTRPAAVLNIQLGDYFNMNREIQVPARHDSRACDIKSKLRQMARVAESGQIRLIALHGHRILHVFQDDGDALTSEHSYLSLRAEELRGDEEDNSRISANRTIEVVVQHLAWPPQEGPAQSDAFQGQLLGEACFAEPFLLSVGPSEKNLKLRERIERRLRVAVQYVQLALVFGGRDAHLMNDREALLEQIDLTYGDYLRASILSEGQGGRSVMLPGQGGAVEGTGLRGTSLRRRNAEAANATAIAAEIEPRTEARLPPVMGAIAGAPERNASRERRPAARGEGHREHEESSLHMPESPRHVVARLLATNDRSRAASDDRRLESSGRYGEWEEGAVTKRHEEYVDALQMVVALEHLLAAEKDKEEASDMVQQLEGFIESQNLLIEQLRSRAEDLEAQLSGCFGAHSAESRDAMEMLEDLLNRDLAGRSVKWLSKCEGAARKLADKLNQTAAAIRRAVPDGFRCPITQV